MQTEMPRAIATVIGDILGAYYYNHSDIETLFYEAGATTDRPSGTCKSKITSWLLQEAIENPQNVYVVLGRVLREYMDTGENRFSDSSQRETNISRIKEILKRYNLHYAPGGSIYGATLETPSRTLGQKLRDKSIPELNAEFERAFQSVESDPPAAITAACAILESLCKIYIEDRQLNMPTKQTLQGLWKVVVKDLNLAPDPTNEGDLNKILSGLGAIVDGVGAFRTHAGSAHGRAAAAFLPTAHHARLAVHAAHTACLFVLEVALLGVASDGY